MTALFLVRHAKPAANWGESVDSGLDEQGVFQADRTAALLGARLPPHPVYTSPLKRCVETAAPLARRWESPAVLLPEVAEIPAPTLPMAARKLWLSQSMAGTWRSLQEGAPPGSPDYLAWRDTLLQRLRAMRQDCVIYSHYIAINVVAGAATGSDRVITFRPAHASVTTIDIVNGEFRLRELGEQGDGGILLGADGSSSTA